MKTVTHTGAAVVRTGLSGPASGDRHDGSFRVCEEKELSLRALRSRGKTRRQNSFYLRLDACVSSPRDLRDFRVRFFLDRAEAIGKQVGSRELQASWVCREHEMQEAATVYLNR